MENANTTPDKEKKKNLGFTLNLVGIPLTIYGGLRAAQIHIRRAFYKNFVRHGVFKDLQDERHEVYKKLTQECFDGLRDDIRKEVVEVEKKYRFDVMKRVEKFGYRNLSDHFGSLKRNERIDSMIMFATVSGIGIGALLAISNQVDKYANERLQNQSQEQERG